MKDSVSKVKNRELETEIIELSKLQVRFDKKNSKSIFSEIVTIREIILNKLGLPYIPEHWFYLCFEKEIKKEETNVIIKQLQTVADKYFSEKVQTDVMILNEARETENDPLTILPQIDIVIDSYTFFLFQQFVVEKIPEKTESILLELKTACKSNIKYQLDLLGTGDIKADLAQINKLQKKGLKHIKKYYDFFFSEIRKKINDYENLYYKYGSEYFVLNINIILNKKNLTVLNKIMILEKSILSLYNLPYTDRYRKIIINCFTKHTYYPEILKRLELAKLKCKIVC